MRTLFLRLFLWFGLAMILVNIASFATGIITERRFQPPRGNALAPMTGLVAQTAVETFELGGAAAVRSYFSRLENTSKVQAVLLNEKNEDVAGQIVAENVKALSARVTETNPFVFEFNSPRTGPPSPYGIQRVQSSQGANYALIARFPPPDRPPPPRIGEPGSLRVGLGIVARTLLPLLIVGGLFCYLLARSLAQPIERLRNTAHELAAGNFGARVDPAFLERRDEIGHLGRDFNHMASQIESLVEAQKRLLADISHELRSPLARQGVALGLARRRGNSEVLADLERIAREARRMNEMIGQLLDLSQVEAGTDAVTKAPIDLEVLVESIVQDADYEARNDRRSVTVVHKEPCATKGAAEMLGSAIENVIRNGVRHTAPNTQVEVALKAETNNGLKSALIIVRDHGAGVPEKALQDIFRPFYRVEDARDRKTGGTGLGLAIATRAIELHGGSITARNVDGGGLQVEIRIPESGWEDRP